MFEIFSIFRKPWSQDEMVEELWKSSADSATDILAVNPWVGPQGLCAWGEPTIMGFGPIYGKNGNCK